MIESEITLDDNNYINCIYHIIGKMALRTATVVVLLTILWICIAFGEAETVGFRPRVRRKKKLKKLKPESSKATFV